MLLTQTQVVWVCLRSLSIRGLQLSNHQPRRMRKRSRGKSALLLHICIRCIFFALLAVIYAEIAQQGVAHRWVIFPMLFQR